jgi:phosphate transport system permease protein
MRAGLARRHLDDRLFRWAGFAAVGFSALILVLLLASMSLNGLAGFERYEIRLDLPVKGELLVDPSRLAQPQPLDALEVGGLPALIDAAAERQLGDEAPPSSPIPAGATRARNWSPIPTFLPRAAFPPHCSASDELANAARGSGAPELQARARKLMASGVLVHSFDWGFLALRRHQPADGRHLGRAQGFDHDHAGHARSRLSRRRARGSLSRGICAPEPLDRSHRNLDQQSCRGALDHFRPAWPCRLLVIFPNDRSAPLVGGMTLALMTMPVIVISGRNAIKAVPPRRDAALAVGASPLQVVFHHVLPMALPGILTGTIIGMARALGETAHC